ncbi:hypothetical protein B0T19DRAFT_482663 [Cercophora scortea]|uniref:Uncharacterized protein n=1 Tax=Cercophora scortea TaxID=314031 RepID=A0AAE0MH70_9PEZI|nr:hypothetical protein B0T19DRAFT_482663 [Cercophora scortea]
MQSKPIYLLLPLLSAILAKASYADASTQTDGSDATAVAKCWVGQIHDACNGSLTGCTPAGIFVVCDEGSGQMIFKNMCGSGVGQGSCGCIDGVSGCVTVPTPMESGGDEVSEGGEYAAQVEEKKEL